MLRISDGEVAVFARGRVSELWVCIGHSHAAALAHAGDPNLDAIDFWETGDPWASDGDGPCLRPDLAERVGRGAMMLSVIGGSAHTVLGMVEHPRPFDFILPDAPDLPLDETRELIPVDAVRAKLAEMTDEHLARIPLVARAARAAVAHLEPPPPVADEARIAPHVPWGLFPGQPRIIAPKWVRYKLWRLHSAVIAAACTRMGVRYIRSPKAAEDGEGFLDARYDRDGAHANGAYGALVLSELRSAA